MGNWPVHSNPRQERAARAPYNFVPLPEHVVTVSPDSLPDQDCYAHDRHTGWINCQLITASPLYVRGPLTMPQFDYQGSKKYADGDPLPEEGNPEFRRLVKNLPAFFYTGDPGSPVIPGSSLRGMLRTMVEIVGYGKVQWVTDQQRYFFRAVAAAKSDPLARPYKEALGQVQAGYVLKENDHWYVLPAKRIHGVSFLKAKENHIPEAVLKQRDRLDSRSYRPRCVSVSFTSKQTPKGRWVIDQVDKPGKYPDRGVMVCSGNMLEAGAKLKELPASPRKNHYIVPEPDIASDRVAIKDLVPIDEDAIRDYRAGLTEFQTKKPFVPQMGCLVERRPIFYLVDPDGMIRAFGHTPNFRVPFRRKGVRRASSPLDYVPEELRREGDTDLAEAIFGYSKSQGDGKQRAYAGRLFVTDAALRKGQDRDKIWLANDEPVTLKILGGPKPTTFQHYLAQTAPNESASLLHYASETPQETVIRGNKFYWNKGDVTLDDIREQTEPQRDDTQHTQIKPVRAGVEFEFRVYFENLSSVELGALLWVLRKAKDDAYRLKLGMGKPYGMGAVKIVPTLHLTERTQRYTELFEKNGWAIGVQPSGALETNAIRAFEELILGDGELNPNQAHSLDKVARIQELLAMLSWPGPEDKDQTQYLMIEHPQRGNEYKGRPVLPSPQAVHTPKEYHRGKVKDFGLGTDKSYGVIRDDDGSDVIVRRGALAPGVTELTRGQVVIFERRRGIKGFEARDVKPLPVES